MILSEGLMAEKAVSEIKDTSKDLLGKITDMEVFKREDKVGSCSKHQQYKKMIISGSRG